MIGDPHLFFVSPLDLPFFRSFVTLSQPIQPNCSFAAITALAKSSKNKHSAKLSNSGASGSSSADDNDGEELWPKALALLQQMDEDGIEPDGFCYSSAINCCGAEGRWEEACALIETMKRGGPKSRPNKVAYTAAISELDLNEYE